MSYLCIDSTIFNLFKIINIILLLEYFVKGLEVEQGFQFILTCSQSKKIIGDQSAHSLFLYIIEMGEPFECLTECKLVNNPKCNRLMEGSLGISCGSRNCHTKPQCNFTFKSPSIKLDGFKVGCYDHDNKVEEWDIKGSNFPYIPVL